MPSADRDQRSARTSPFTLTRLAWLIPLTAVGIALRLPIRDNSYLWHVRVGELQSQHGSVLTHDPFSFTAAGEPWRTQSWLMDVFYGWIEGWRALASADVTVFISAVVLLLAVGLRLARKPGGLMGPLGLVGVMWITLGYFTARPVFPSLAMLSLVVLVADDDRLRWLLAPLFWVWAGLHGGFVVGLGYLILQAFQTRDRRWKIHIVAAAIGASLTAHGWAVWEILFQFGGSTENLDLIREWRPPDLLSVPLLPFLLGLVGLLVGGMNGRFARRALWVILPFFLFAFSANRAVPMAAIVLAPFAVPAIGNRRIGSNGLARPVGWAMVVTLLAVAWLIPMETIGLEGTFPVEAAKQLAPLPTFHDDAVGGYLIYQRFAPGAFVDDRAELYGSLYADALAARDAEPGWNDLFEDHHVKQVLLLKTDAIVEVLDALDWATSFEDEKYVVMLAPSSDR